MAPTAPRVPFAIVRARIAIVGSAVAILLGIQVVQAISPLWLATPALQPALTATAVVTAVQLAASLAGRGRPMPGLRLVPLARGLAALTLLAYSVMQILTYLAGPGSSFGPSPEVAVALGAILSLILLALCEASARLGGPGIATIGAVIARVLAIASVALRSFAPFLIAHAIDLAAMIAVVVALRRAGWTRDRLGLVGITPWAPSDVALVPGAVGSLALYAAFSAGARRFFTPGLYTIVDAALTIALTLATLAALRYLGRRLREAEAHAAARAAVSEVAP